MKLTSHIVKLRLSVCSHVNAELAPESPSESRLSGDLLRGQFRG